MLVAIFGILLVMIPVAGLTVALTLRFAVKPFVETLAQALRESGQGPSTQQIEALSENVEFLTSEVQRLGEAQRFDQELLAEPTVPTEQS